MMHEEDAQGGMHKGRLELATSYLGGRARPPAAAPEMQIALPKRPARATR